MTRTISGLFRQTLAVAALSVAAAAQLLAPAYDTPSLNTPGTLDPTFDGDGRRTFEFFPNSSVATSSVRQPDGKIVVVGANDTSIYPVGVARFNPNGNLDTTFGDGGKKVITNPIRTSLFDWKVALQSDGKILIAGSFQSVNGFDFAVIRLNSDGSMDTTFDGDGVFFLNFLGETEAAYDLAVQPDGKIILVGGIYFANIRSFGIARILPNGGVDLTFGTGNGTMITDIRDPGSNGFLFAEAFAVGLRSDGKIVVSGRGFTGNLTSYTVLARYTANGVLDTTFSGDGLVVSPHPVFFSRTYMKLQSDGKILLGVSGRIFRYNTDGTLDNTWSDDGEAIVSGVLGHDMALQPDGKLVVSGYTFVGNSQKAFIAARLLADGTTDTTFDGDGVTITPLAGDINIGPTSVIIQPDDKIVVTGTAQFEVNEFTTVRYNADGSPDVTFSGDSIASVNVGNAAAEINQVIRAGDRLFTIGRTVLQSQSGTALARFNANGTFDTTFSGDGKDVFFPLEGNFSGIAGSRLPSGNTILLVEYWSGANRVCGLRLLDPTGVFINGYGLIPAATGDESCRAMDLQFDLKPVVAGRAFTGISNDFAVFRYDGTGLLDATWGSGGKAFTSIAGGSSDDQANAIARQPDGKMVAAGSASDGTNTDFALVRYDGNGMPDPTFGTNGVVTTNFNGTSEDVIHSIVIQADGKIVAAGYSSEGGVDRFALARYNPDGTLDDTFDGDGRLTTTIGADARARSIVIQPSGRIIAVGGTIDSNGVGDFATVRYNANGSLDDSLWGTGGISVTDLGSDVETATSVMLDANGNAVVAGNSGARSGVVRYIAALAPTAAGVSVSGRVATADGYGISRVTVTITDTSGRTRSVITNPFGYFRFDDIPAGQSVVLTATAKRYAFEPVLVDALEDVTGIELTPLQQTEKR